ncbi:E3 ubiquitin-protein ligase TRIM71-like [Mytilus trossulus]|uniref:E3 ubiquitin-protein ligase TRIM71-like n=1 Tax=Mytilus trossulus TaxID=6551 RepID=UPI003007EA03
MASNLGVCGVCDHRHVTKSSVVWCSECDEGLCEDCKEHHSFSKATRNHEVVPIDEYMKLPVKILQIAQFCNKHNEKYELFCRKHDCPCCRKCIEDHNECKDLTDIRNMISNVKSSTAFKEIERTLSETAENMKRIRKIREENLALLAEKIKIVELEVQQFRNKINEHLDKLQDEILKEIKMEEDKESSKIRQLVTSLRQREKEILQCKDNIENTKRYGSDLQSFIAMKHIEKDIIKEENYIQSISKSEQLHQIDISWTIDTALQELTTAMKMFGEVNVSSSACAISIKNKGNIQAQIIVPTTNHFDNFSLKLKQTIQTNLKAVRGCTFLPDGRIVFSSISSKLVRVIKPDGSFDSDLNIIGTVWDVVYIGDNDIAVTSGGASSNKINIIDVPNRKVKKVLNVNSANTGVTFNAGKLIYCAVDKGLKMISLCNESITSITTSKMSSDACVAFQGDKLFYANEDNHNVTCCDIQGKILWTFNKESTLSYPMGISVDNDGNVYVAGFISHNVVVISTDGQRYRQLLSEKDGLHCPSAVEYDRTNNKLLVADRYGSAFVYDVIGQ